MVAFNDTKKQKKNKYVLTEIHRFLIDIYWDLTMDLITVILYSKLVI